MNCFPCKGPACNSCKKFDRINRAVEQGGSVRCKLCGAAVDLSQGKCPACGMVAFKAPGER